MIVFLYLPVQVQSSNALSSATKSCFESEQRQATTVVRRVALAFLLAVQMRTQILEAAINTPRNYRKMPIVLDRCQ